MRWPQVGDFGWPSGYGIKITPYGEFESCSGKRSFGIPSPIEQNNRHIHFLRGFLQSQDILPKRMGIPIKARFYSLILIAPQCIISRSPGKGSDTSPIIKADKLRTKIDEMVDQNSRISDLPLLGKLSSLKTVEEFAKKLASCHAPFKVNMRKKYGLLETGDPSVNIAPPKFSCEKCRKAISAAEADYCLRNKLEFAGKTYCFRCQNASPVVNIPQPTPSYSL